MAVDEERLIAHVEGLAGIVRALADEVDPTVHSATTLDDHGNPIFAHDHCRYCDARPDYTGTGKTTTRRGLTDLSLHPLSCVWRQARELMR